MRRRASWARARENAGLAVGLLLGAGALGVTAAPLTLGLFVAGSAVVFGLKSLSALQAAH